jgi:exopolysaccharide biosynthesis polyprenyl glycosylphosphotransferase
VAPALQALVAPGGALHLEGLNWLTLPGGSLDRLPSLSGGVAVLALTIVVHVTVTELLRGYRDVERISRTRLLAPAVLGPIAGLSLFTLAVFGLRIHHAWSRVFLFSYLVLSVALLGSYRVALRTYKRRRLAAGRYARATAFIGAREDIERALGHLPKTHEGTWFRAVGYFSIGPPSLANLALPRLGTVEAVASVLVHTPVDLIVVILPERGALWLDEVVRTCDYLRIDVQVVPAALVGLTTTLTDLRTVDGGNLLPPLPGVTLRPWDVDLGALFVKRLIDVTAASILLVGLSPLFAVIALALKLTNPREPVLYRWQVIGYKGRPFTGYKFRTMVADADRRRTELMHLNEMSGPVFKIKADPRITRLGAVLRKFSLNELPQLWSVFTGDMSLVGPRPAGAWEIGQYEDWHKRKLTFRPGITCLWQVRGRNKISQFDDWVRMDLEYIDHWSLWLDFKILFRTVWVVAAGSGS